MRPLLCLLLALSVASAEIVPKEWLVIPPVDRRGRRPFHPDAVFRKHLLDPAAAPPRAGDELTGERGEARAWTARTVDEEGWLDGKDVAWAYAAIDVPSAGVMLATLFRGARLFVNGVGYTGDIYGGGGGPVPVRVRQGVNHVYVAGVRGRFHFQLEKPTTRWVVLGLGHTMPDLVVGERIDLPAGIMVANASLSPARGIEVTGGGEPFAEISQQSDEVVPPLGLRLVRVGVAGFTPRETGGVTFRLAIRAAGDEAATMISFPLKVRAAGAARMRTFVSDIDGSVQYYAILPPLEEGNGLVLSAHGAGVHAHGQARSYSRKKNLWIVAPTNRRPFGFDWQDWGRRDAYEALEDALKHTGADRRRVYLTGHSMGGHGTWHLAANDPDTFAAIAPSAGWCSFDTYGGRPKGEHTALWHAADLPSLTLEFTPNLVALPTFVLHGEDDDNVPVSEAKRMLAALRAAGGEPRHHFQPGAGHWWDGGAAPGADCVDWPGIFDLFARSVRPETPPELDWVTAGIGVDDEHYWVKVHAPLRYGEKMRVRATFDGGTVTATTTNVAALTFAHPDARRYRIDGDVLEEGTTFRRDGERWTPGAAVAGKRYGPFKRAFDNRFVLAYGTAGTEAETAALFERARFDAQVWWYRGNGRAPVVADGARPSGNVILYGNRDTNRLWDKLLKDCPIEVERGRIRFGDREWKGDDLACVFVQPGVGAFGSTGVRGTRLGYTLLHFVSGVGYPDYVIFDAGVLAKGDGGVLAAGWLR